MTAAGAAVALLIGLGVLPAGGSAASGVAAFPVDAFFDVKQALAQSTNWFLFGGVVVLSVAIRSGVLAATLVLSEGNPSSLFFTWRRTAVLVAAAEVILFPAAALMFIGVASRYAPFVWTAAVAGFFPAVALARRAVRVDTGEGPPETAGLPETFSFLGYAYLVSFLGAVMSSLAEFAVGASAAIVVFTAPLHALIFLGWRAHVRKGTYPGGGALASALTAVMVAVLFLGATYDRYIRKLPPVARTDTSGTLVLVGGVDSTLESGALTGLETRNVGYPRERSRMLSYRADGRPMTRADTRGSLDRATAAVAAQIADEEPPVVLLGHSQAALIVDRLIGRGLEVPERGVLLAPPPPFPPSVAIPPPGRSGIGAPGGDVARAVAASMRAAGINPYDVDAAAFPTNLETVVVRDTRVPRLSVWALGDSVWLDRDWRRPGETNVVALTDHVGIVNNGRAITTTRDFLQGGEVAGDEASWRGAVVSILRHVFAPWRPEA